MSNFPDVQAIYLSAAEAGETLVDPDASTEVVVKTSEGLTYSAQFCTTENIRAKLDTHSDLISPDYLWWSNLVVVNEINADSVKDIIDHMIDEGDFQLIFRKLS